MSTEKLYYQDAYCKEFTAQVLSCAPAKGGWAVTLDRTAFYPEGGGQPCDRGTLGGAQVLDVQEMDGGIVHTCDAPLCGEVAGRIDWERRFDLMQQHSGEHLFSGLVHRLFGFDNVGFHMGADVITIDFSGVIPPQALPELERQVNEWIWQDAETQILLPSPAELETLRYRSKKELTGQVRIVRFPGMDDCACCGTHVARTGEIGLLKLLSCVKFHQGVRLELVCGGRALDYLTRIFGQNREISGLLSAKPLETAAAVRRAADELAALKYELTGWKKRYFAARAEALLCGGDPASAVLTFEPALSPADVQQLCLLLAEQTDRVCAVFSGSDAEGYKYAVGQCGGDVRGLVRELNAACCGRGGGKPQIAQGSAAAARSEIEAFFGSRLFRQ